MTDMILANFPAMTVISPEAIEGGFEIKFDEDKGYVKTSSQIITVKAFKRTRPGHEWLSNFYLIVDSGTGEVFANPETAVVTSDEQPHKVTVGVEFGDTIKIDGTLYRMEEAPNSNMNLVRA